MPALADNKADIFRVGFDCVNYAALILGFDGELGAGRPIAERTVVEVFDGVWFSVPPDWVTTRMDASVKVTDPTDEAGIEVSHQPYPLHPRLPGLTERLLAAFSDRNVTADQVVAVDRGDLELAWTAYEYDAVDTKTGDKRPARARALIAANDVLQALVTFAYWPSDEGWAAQTSLDRKGRCGAGRVGRRLSSHALAF